MKHLALVLLTNVGLTACGGNEANNNTGDPSLPPGDPRSSTGDTVTGDPGKAGDELSGDPGQQDDELPGDPGLGDPGQQGDGHGDSMGDAAVGDSDLGDPIACIWFADCDGDGFAALGAESSSVCPTPAGPPASCAGGTWTDREPLDCDDTDGAVHPDAPEICDAGIDNDCSGSADDDDPSVTGTSAWYVDCDHDGYAANTTGSISACDRPSAGPASCPTAGTWTDFEPTDSASSDCADGDDTLNPQTPWWRDRDHDGYVSASEASYVLTQCEQPTENGHTWLQSSSATVPPTEDDCQPLDERAHPNQTACFAAPLASGNFDYNCANGNETCLTRIYTGGTVMCPNPCSETTFVGWNPGPVPPCGEFAVARVCPCGTSGGDDRLWEQVCH